MIAKELRLNMYKDESVEKERNTMYITQICKTNLHSRPEKEYSEHIDAALLMREVELLLKGLSFCPVDSSSGTIYTSFSRGSDLKNYFLRKDMVTQKRFWTPLLDRDPTLEAYVGAV